MSYLVAIVGRPNVGKSTLFNRLIGEKRAILAEEPGTTRDVLFSNVTWNKITFTVADTAGIELDNKSELTKNVMLQTKAALTSADLILFLVSAKEGIHPDDQAVAKLVRKHNKPILLLINKTDKKVSPDVIADFLRLGFKQTFETSSITGKGIGEVLDETVFQLNKIKRPIVPTVVDENLIRVAILGRPNVGKSTLFNKLIGKDRSLVSKIAGTTRDTIDERVAFDGCTLEFVDTAGLRRRGKVEVGIEKFSSLRMLRAVQASDICLVLMEADEGVIAQDQHIIEMVLELSKSPILVVNKWDLIEKTGKVTADYDKYLNQKYRFATWIPKIYVSALTGQRVDKIKQLVTDTWTLRNIQLTDEKINDIIKLAVIKRTPSGKYVTPVVHSARQVATNPPKIELVADHPEGLHFTYLRYLENKLRETWPLPGVPIIFAPRPRARHQRK
ncbi:MAG: ribosome biogenesis GTPase Der [Patescibacteria group bacterium]